MSAGEDNTRKYQRRVRVDERDDENQTVGYIAPTGEETAVTGDDDAPYTGPLVRSSSDGVTGLVTEANGVNNRIAADQLGRLWVRVFSSEPIDTQIASTPGSAASFLLVASNPCVVYAARCLVIAGIAADRWLMIFDGTIAPSPGDVPVWRALVPNSTNAAEAADSFSPGLPMANGCTVAISTTQDIYTAPGSPEAFFHVQYELTS